MNDRIVEKVNKILEKTPNKSFLEVLDEARAYLVL